MTTGEELATYLQVIRRHLKLLLISLAVGLLAAVFYNSLATPLYSATATLRVASAPTGLVDEVWVYNSLATRLMNTYLEYATSDPVQAELESRLGNAVKPRIEAEAIPETELFQLAAWHPDPGAAQEAANIVAAILVDRSLELYRGDSHSARQILAEELTKAKSDLDLAIAEYENAYQACLTSIQPTADPSSSGGSGLGAGGAPVLCASQSQLEILSQVVSLRRTSYVDLLQRYEDLRVREALLKNAVSIMEAAPFPALPSRPNKLINLALGLVLGAAVGLVAAFVREGMDTSVHSAEQVEAMTDIPILAQIPEIPKRRKGRQSEATGRTFATSFDLDPFYQLRARLLSMGRERPMQRILVTSAEPGVGKSIVSAHLALALSRSRYTVALVDADLRRPSLHNILQAEESRVGQRMTALAPPVWMDNYQHHQVNEHLSLFVPASQADKPQEPIEVRTMTTLLSTLAKSFSYIVIDSTAMLSVVDPSLLMPKIDMLLLVVGLRHTERSHLRQALLNLTLHDEKLMGIVINRVPRSIIHRYYSRRPSARA